MSDDPIIQLGLADLELERCQEAIQEAFTDVPGDFGSDSISPPTDWFWFMLILVSLKQLFFLREGSGDWVWMTRITYELATLLSDQEEFQKSPDLLQTNWYLVAWFWGLWVRYALALQAENDREKRLGLLNKGSRRIPLMPNWLLASQLSYELHQFEQAEAYLLEAKVADDLEEIAFAWPPFIWNRTLWPSLGLAMKKSKQLSLGGTFFPSCLGCFEKTEEAVSAYQELYEDLKDNPEFLEAYVYLLREAGGTKAREVLISIWRSYQTMCRCKLYDSL